jgi:hypothetical protein
MLALHTAKPATALHGEPASNCEHTGGGLEIENTLSEDTPQQETALGSAMRKALARKAEARS